MPKLGMVALAWAIAGIAIAETPTIPDVTLPSSYGEQVSLSKLRGEKATVIAFLSVDCPISNGYVPTLNAMTERFSKEGASFVALNPNRGQNLREMAAHRDKFKVLMPILKDQDGRVAKSLGIAICPAVCVFDAKGELCYRGRIDDRYFRRGGAPRAVRSADLENALAAAVAGKPVASAETQAVGCPVVFPKEASVASKSAGGETVTYFKHVAPILQKHCQECHRSGGVAPFELTNYEQASQWAPDIQHFTAEGVMPPWSPAPGIAFHNERRMSKDEIALIAQWVEAGAQEGDAKDAPPPASFGEEWAMGEPDFILEMPEEYELGADGVDDYRHFVIPTNFDKDMHIAAMEVKPGNRRVVHHVIAYVDTRNRARRLDEQAEGPGYSTTGGGLPGFLPDGGIGGWAPGNAPHPHPAGMAVVLPKGADVVMQVHYHRTGREEKDRTKIGVYLAKPPITRIVRAFAVVAIDFRLGRYEIPANDPNFEIKTSMVVPEDAIAISTTPHMHLLGKDMKVTATLPNGEVRPMIDLPRWDFNWQGTYQYQEPIALPAGTRLDLVAHFDNSENNPFNPRNPPKGVQWGEGTDEEMCLCFFEVVPKDEAKSPEDLKAPDTNKMVSKFILSQLKKGKVGASGRTDEFKSSLFEKEAKEEK